MLNKLEATLPVLLENDFDESELPFKVDLVDWASTSESFRKVISKTAVVLLPLDEEV
ncbi:MAG: hypothetical protein HYS23_00325 [Geobacter sp.]|nr:hypothetical protein [Geobacter sp.]